MSGIFSQLTQEAQRQQELLKTNSPKNDIDDPSDAVTSRTDAMPSKTNKRPEQTIDTELMSKIVANLSDAKTLSNAISIRMTEEEKEYVDDFILVTLRKAGLQGHQVSIAKLMRYALIYVLFKHHKEFLNVLKSTLTKDESTNLFK